MLKHSLIQRLVTKDPKNNTVLKIAFNNWRQAYLVQQTACLRGTIRKNLRCN